MRTKQGPARKISPPRKRRKQRDEDDANARGKPCCDFGAILPADIGGPQPKTAAARRGKGVDRISQLPDAVLGEIISLLPTKDGARTQILASSWRHLWRSAPLNLDCNSVKEHAIAVVLTAHPGPGRRFCSPTIPNASPATMDTWLQSPSLQNLQELEFCGRSRYLHAPASAFRCCFWSTLCVATIRYCRIDQALQFPKLKQLTLENVSTTEGFLHSMVQGCPALECLLLIGSFGFPCVRISSLSLRSMGVRARSKYYSPNQLIRRELVIHNAPCLERLLHLDYLFNTSYRVSAPKLETLGPISDSHDAYVLLGSTVIQRLQVDSMTTMVHTIKILAVDMASLNLDTAIGFLRCFPSLEKMYVKASVPTRRRKMLHRKDLDDMRLKKIVLECYHGTKLQIDFVKFFLANAKVLELMTLRVESRYYDQMFLAEQHKTLQLEMMASKGARLHFTTHRCVRDVSDINHVQDLDLRDPFHCNCC